MRMWVPSGARFNFQPVSGMGSLEETPSSLGTDPESLPSGPVAESSFGVSRGNTSAGQ